ncbi:MAG: GNAT family N-acetyltransferase [Actinomycetaceae bacterium]|nr:GNAT family N-acetyltransferase [Actinomycetaceae bacterium]
MHWPGRKPPLRRLHGGDRARAIAYCEEYPVDTVFIRAGIEQSGFGVTRVIGQFDPSKRLVAAAWDQGNVVPVGFGPEGLDDLAKTLLGRWRSCSSLVGPAEQVLGLWERVSDAWGPAREVRPRQHSMVIDGDPKMAGDPDVRPARIDEIQLVFPASVAMYEEEVGYDPTSHGAAYANRVLGLVRSGHTFIRTGPARDGAGERVIFKADVGALAGGVAQLQGVWVAPDLRGQGIAKAGIAAVVEQVRARLAPTVSLYVNDYNAAAVAAYRRVGFRVEGQWATVLI